MKTHNDLTQLKATLRELIIEELDRQLPLPPQQPEVAAGHVSVKELCDLLQVSRQTIANWRKDATINQLLVSCQYKIVG